MKIQYREFEVPAMIAIKGADENHVQKNQTVFDFLSQFSSPIEGPAMIAIGVGWEGGSVLVVG